MLPFFRTSSIRGRQSSIALAACCVALTAVAAGIPSALHAAGAQEAHRLQAQGKSTLGAAAPDRQAARGFFPALRGVVPVVALDASGNAIRRGIGFFVAIGRLVVPRGLLGDRAYTANVIYGGREQRVTAVLADDSRAGLVLVAVDLPDGAPPALQPRMSAKGVSGGSYQALGAGGLATPVDVAAEREVPGLGPACGFTAAGTAPESGSPVVDANGELMGVVVNRAAGDSRLSFVLPAARLQQMTPAGPLSVADWSARIGQPGPAGANAALLRGADASLGNRPGEAVEHFREAASGEAASAEAIGALAASELAAGRPADAIASYRRAIAVDPGNAAWHHHLAVALGDTGRWDEAAGEFAEVARIRPSDAEAHFNLGGAYGALRRYQQEYDAYQAAIGLNSTHLGALRNLGIACIALKRYEEAASTFTRAIRLAPGDAELHTELGVAYFDLRQYAAAIQELKKAVELAPQAAKPHYGLAVVYAASGQRDAALGECETLKGLDPARAEDARRIVTAVPR